nr:hypothetical protein [Tanacetum cinerariifolium]
NGDAIVFNIVPNVLNIAKTFGVPFKTFTGIKDLINGLEIEKASTTNVGEGFVGRDNFDDVAAHMHRLNGKQTMHATDTQSWKAISHDSTSSFESAFAEGDRIGVSSSARRININQMSNVTSYQENSNRVGLNNSKCIVNSNLLPT